MKKEFKVELDGKPLQVSELKVIEHGLLARLLAYFIEIRYEYRNYSMQIHLKFKLFR